MTAHNNNTDNTENTATSENLTHRERPLGHLAAAVSHRTRHAVRAALAEAGVSQRELRLLTILEREPQTAEGLAERRARRIAEREERRAHSGHGRRHHGRGHRHEMHGAHAHHGGSRRDHEAHGAEGEFHGHRRGGRPSLEGRLASLEERGLIQKDASGILSLTDDGRALRTTARDTLAAVRERSHAGVTEADLETTRRTLQALAHNLAGSAS